MDTPTDRSTDQNTHTKRMRWGRKHWYITVIAVVVVSVGAFFVWRTVVARGLPQFIDFGIDNTNGALLRERLEESTKRAQENWHSDAYPIAVSLMFEGTKASEIILPIVYFASPSDFNNEFFVKLTPDLKGFSTSSSEPKEQMQPLIGRLALTASTWPIGYNDILKIAEDNGGKEFRKAHPNAQIIMELSNTEVTGSEWAVYYADRDEELDLYKLTIYIDSITGRINDKKS